MTGTRERFLRAGAELFRRKGFQGTATKDIMARAGAPSGSLYHFFPGGKEQLGVEAARRSGERYQRLIRKVIRDAGHPAEVIGAFFRYAADALTASDYADGCPIGTLALDVASSHEPVREVCAAVLQDWQDVLADELWKVGWSRREAQSRASFAVAALEGAILLGRTQRSIEPLRRTARHVRDVLEQSPSTDARAAGADSTTSRRKRS